MSKFMKFFFVPLFFLTSLVADTMMMQDAIQVGAFSNPKNIDRRINLLHDFQIHKKEIDGVVKLYVVLSKDENLEELLYKIQTKVPGAFKSQLAQKPIQKPVMMEKTLKVIHIGNFCDEIELDKAQKTYQFFTLHKEQDKECTTLYITSKDIYSTVEKIKFFKNDAKITTIKIAK